MLNVSLIEEAPSSGDQGPLKGVNTVGHVAIEASPHPH